MQRRSSDGYSRPRRENGRGGSSRRKVCQFCHDHVREIDYKDANRFMKRFISNIYAVCSVWNISKRQRVRNASLSLPIKDFRLILPLGVSL